MSNIAVVYQSKYGWTKKYAQWLAQELKADIFENTRLKIKDIEKYNTILFGGGIYAGGVDGINFIGKNFDKLKDKKLILFTCGLSDPNDQKNIDNIQKSLQKKLTEEMLDKIKVFYLRGGIDYSELSFVHKSMMGMLHKMILKKDEEDLTEEDQGILDSYGKNVDFTDKETIKPIIEYIES